MISVLPGKSFEFKNHNTDLNLEGIIVEVSRLIRCASPFMESIEILNKTKGCSVDICFQNQKLQVIFKNPHDEVFDLNEMENPIAPPISITGR